MSYCEGQRECKKRGLLATGKADDESLQRLFGNSTQENNKGMLCIHFHLQ
jgi:hypothetical protein